MIELEDWQVPLHYGSMEEEHHAVREAVGLFDMSPRSLITLMSDNAQMTQAFLETLIPRDLSTLLPGKAVYTQLLSKTGGIVDDILLYKLSDTVLPDGRFGQFLIVCSGFNTRVALSVLQESAAKKHPSFKIESLHTAYTILALQGPRFSDVLARLGYVVETIPKERHLVSSYMQDIPVLLSRTGRTGEDGVEIVVHRQYVVQLWQLLLNSGKACSVKPVGFSARNVLRLEAGYPLFGCELTEKETPLEAGLNRSLQLSKPSAFNGQKKLLRQQRVGYEKQLYCFVLCQKIIASQHDVIYKNNKAVGHVTSNVISPLLNVSIGMGYITLPLTLQPGDDIHISHQGQLLAAEIVEKPFYQKPV